QHAADGKEQFRRLQDDLIDAVDDEPREEQRADSPYRLHGNRRTTECLPPATARGGGRQECGQPPAPFAAGPGRFFLGGCAPCHRGTPAQRLVTMFRGAGTRFRYVTNGQLWPVYVPVHVRSVGYP